MRLIVIKQSTDLQALGAQLIGKKTGDAATLDRLKSLNPHVDFNRIGPGTVLLLPDSPDLKAGANEATISPVGEAIDGIARDVDDGFKASAERMRNAVEALNIDLRAVSEVTKSAAVKRLIDGDPSLKKQLDGAVEAANNQQKTVREAATQMEALQKMVDEEFAALGKMLR